MNLKRFTKINVMTARNKAIQIIREFYSIICGGAEQLPEQVAVDCAYRHIALILNNTTEYNYYCDVWNEVKEIEKDIFNFAEIHMMDITNREFKSDYMKVKFKTKVNLKYAD